MYSGIKLIRTELVLFPFRLKIYLFQFPILISVFSSKTPDITEKHPRVSVRRTLSSNFVFTIWAVFGGFILHFLLCNFLTVLLRPRYEKPVETTADVIERNITLILWPEAGWKEYHAASPDSHLPRILQKNCYSQKLEWIWGNGAQSDIHRNVCFNWNNTNRVLCIRGGTQRLVQVLWDCSRRSPISWTFIKQKMATEKSTVKLKYVIVNIIS